MGIVAGVVIAVGMLVATTVARRPVTGAPLPRRPAAAGRRTRSRHPRALCRRHPSPPAQRCRSARCCRRSCCRRSRPGSCSPARSTSRRGCCTPKTPSAAVRRADRPRAVRGARLGMWSPAASARSAPSRSRASIFALAALSIVGALWAARRLDLRAGRRRRHRLRRHAVAAHGDAARRDLARRATSGPGRAGAFSGVWTAGETVGFALGATTLTVILAVTGYVSSTAGESVAQPDAAIAGIVDQLQRRARRSHRPEPADTRPLPPAPHRHRVASPEIRRTSAGTQFRAVS